MKKFLCLIFCATAMAACSSTSVTRTQALSENADAPYSNLLVISLGRSFDARRYFEDAIVSELENQGVRAVASTSKMNTKTPFTRETFVNMVKSLDSDAVLVTQLVDVQSRAKMKDMNPETTRIFRPTYYYNVWSVEVTEYVEPQSMIVKSDLVLAAQVFSTRDLEPVWSIETEARIVQDPDQQGSGLLSILKEAGTIADYMSRDGLLAP